MIVVDRGNGAVLQALETPEPVTALASDPTGQWLAVGTAKGTVSVYECETEPKEFRISDSEALHEAAVTALLFETDELRFLSAGADQKLLSTHARGKLEAEDRGRGRHARPAHHGNGRRAERSIHHRQLGRKPQELAARGKGAAR